MAMTVVVTRNVEERYRGFLASCMLEIAAGVYTGPRMTTGVRDRVWRVLSDWHRMLGQGSIVMTWADLAEPGGQGVKLLGEPARNLYEADGALLVRRPTQATPP